MPNLNVLDTHGSLTLIRTMAGRSKLKVSLSDKEIQPYTDAVSKTIFITRPRHTWTEQQYMVWMGEIMHEIGHWRAHNAEIMQYFMDKGLNMQTKYGTLVNMFADVINDRQWGGSYDGTSRNVCAAQMYHAGKGIKNVQEAKRKGELPIEGTAKLIVDCFAWYYHRRADTFQPALRPIANLWVKEIPIPDQLTALDSEFDALETAEDIQALVEKILPPEEQEEAFDPPPPPSGDGDGDGEDEVEGDGPPKEGKGSDKKGKPGKDGKGESSTFSYKDLLNHEHTASGGATKGGSHIKYDHEWKDNYVPFDRYNEYKEFNTEHAYEHTVSAITEGFESSSSLSKAVARMIRIRSMDADEYGLRSGKIHARSLHKVAVGDTAVFRRKMQNTITKDTAVEILVDISGSMHGSRFYCAGAAMALLNDALMPVGVSFDITLFSEGSCPDYFLIKQWHERVANETLILRYASCERYMRDNPDGEALLYAYNRLRTRPEKKKVLIVLSDGYPCTGADGDAARHLQVVAEEVGKHCDLFGIGIQTTSVERFYKHNCHIKKPDELESKLIEVIRTKILG